MKICWDTLEKVKYNPNTGAFKMGRNIYYEYDACLECGEPYLHSKKNGKYCSYKCVHKSDIFKDKFRGKNNHCFGRTGELHPMFGRTGDLHHWSGKKSHNNKGDIASNNIPLYDTYAPQLEPYEKCVRDPEDPKILNVFCIYCGKQYRPTRYKVKSRITYGIKYNNSCRFYCTNDCKQKCPIFHKSADQIMKLDRINANKDIIFCDYISDRVLNREQKKQRLEENGYTCDGCDISVTIKTCILHHEVPVKINPLMVADEINLWAFCKECHEKAHKLDGCNCYELSLI
jgi:hypothetical protein